MIYASIADIDMPDGTWLLAIKPFIPVFDSHPVFRAGWVDTCRVTAAGRTTDFTEVRG